MRENAARNNLTSSACRSAIRLLRVRMRRDRRLAYVPPAGLIRSVRRYVMCNPSVASIRKGHPSPRVGVASKIEGRRTAVRFHKIETGHPDGGQTP